MKWERYNQLGIQDKEEYQYRFIEKIKGYNNITLLGIILLILGLHTHIIMNIYGLLVMIYGNTMFWIITFKKNKWLKSKGV